MILSPTSIALLVTVVLLAGLTAIAYRYRERPGAKLFGILQGLSALWAATALVSWQLPPGPLQLRVWGLNTGLSLIVVIFWFSFILSYTGRESYLSVRRLGLISIPLAFGAGLYFTIPSWPPIVGQVEQLRFAGGTIVDSSIGIVGGFLGLYIYLVLLAGIAVIVKTIIEGNSLFIGQALALLLGSVVTMSASFLEVIGVPVAGYPLTEVALGGQSLLWGYAVFGQQFLQVVPAVATLGERSVFSDL